MADEHPTIRTLLTAVTAVAIPFGYFAAPLLRFTDAATLAIAGTAIGVGASCTWMALRENWGRPHEIFYSVMLVGGLAGLTYELKGAADVSYANNLRCTAIQRDMLSAHSRMANPADAFQALGCRPQGRTGIMVPPTDRETKARRPLPDGGYLRW